MALVGLTEEQVLADERMAESETVPDDLTGRVHPFPHPGAARNAQLERGPAQHLVFVAGEQDIELASKVD